MRNDRGSEVEESSKHVCYDIRSSPISAERVAGTIDLSSVTLSRGRIYWIEGRSCEAGRSVLVRACGAEGQRVDVTPSAKQCVPEQRGSHEEYSYNVGSGVHEYGGGAYAVSGDCVWFSNIRDGRVYEQTVTDAQTATGVPVPLIRDGKPAGAEECRYADLVVDPVRRRLLAVRETHRDGAPAVNDLVSISMDGGAVQALASGHDFYAAPTASPDGRHLAWLAWNQPDMPWDGAALWLAELDRDGTPRTPVHIAGGAGSAVFQPAWSPDGALWCVVDPGGWWNLHRWRDGELRCMYRTEGEFGRPLKELGMKTFGFDDRGSVVCTWRGGGAWRLGRLDPNGTMTEIPSLWTTIEWLAVEGSTAAFVGGAPDRGAAVVSLDLDTGDWREHRRSSEPPLDASTVSRPFMLTYPTGDGTEVAHGYYYAPRNPDIRKRDGHRPPPLLVTSHGGPVGATTDTLNPSIQFWTSRGFGVLDVDYRGSTGYGRAYRERIYGEWGVVDVEDCIAGALHLVETGCADPNRLAIRGESASGYTALCALTRHDIFRAGAVYYGVCDLWRLAAETHKFEARYLDRLIGPRPAALSTYRARSPLYHASSLRCPVIFFQGLKDKVVPPSQVESMKGALDRQGVVGAEYHEFPDEEHGFRKAETRRECLKAELEFYCKVFSSPPSGETASPSTRP